MWWLTMLACTEDPGKGTTPSTTSPPTSLPTTDPTTDPTSPQSGDRRHDCGGIEPADVAPLGGRVALTFDDGPLAANTDDVLDVLDARDLPATFFWLGAQLSDPSNWATAERIVDDPRWDVGNHSWSHTDLITLSLDEVDAEVVDTEELMDTFGVRPDFFRFPYGDSTCDTHDLVTDAGYSVAGWHIDTADWCYASGGGACSTDDYWRVAPEYEEDFEGLVLDQLRRFDGGVVLLHDIHAFTAERLDGLVEQLLEEGFTFVSLDDPTTFPNLVAGTPADLPYLGEACSVSADLCFHAEHAAWCESTDGGDDGICTMDCEGYCPDRDGAATTFCADAGGAGQCVGRSDTENASCEALPGTVEVTLDRFGYPAGTEVVCAPSTW